MTYNYSVWKEDGIWSAYAPAVPGVFGIGDTRDAAVRDLHDGIAEMCAFLRESGQRCPRSSKVYAGSVVVQ